MSVGIEALFDSAPTPEGLARPDDQPLAADAPIDRLRPGTEAHQKVLDRLKERIDMSKREMSKFYTRWRFAERQYQAYLAEKTVDEFRKASNKQGTPPELVTVTVPYSYATVQTIVTYLVHTFCGRKPMYQVGFYRSDTAKRAKNLEQVLQYNIDHVRGIRKYIQYFLDGEKYGVQVLRTLWTVKQQRRTRWKEQNPGGFLASAQPLLQQAQEDVIVFEGNELYNIDPYNFFPDPRCPMEEVNEKGEFVFWRTYDGMHSLKKAQASGQLKWVDNIEEGGYSREEVSDRQALAEGDAVPGRLRVAGKEKNFVELFQGTVEIVPSEWGLGDSDRHEKWIFTLANGRTIIQAEPVDLDHDRHPIIVGEPYSDGYGFGNIGISDMLGPMQETLSWLINSHMFNVRSVLNNTLVVNPQMVDMNDLAKPGPGRVIKLKPAAFGQDPKNAIMQLQVGDITRSHIPDLQVIQRMGDMISAVNDNMRGIQEGGGRKTATEVRTSGEAGASRLAAHARMVSSQSMSPHAEMMALNLQQNLSQDLYLQVLGPEAAVEPLMVTPDGIAGDFYYPVHDGTLPLDRVAMLDVWREIFTVIVQNELLAQQYNAPAIFEYLAELGGAKNLSQFKVQAAPDALVAAQAQQGNVIPMDQAAAAMGGGGMSAI